jgi:hypothetical protein
LYTPDVRWSPDGARILITRFRSGYEQLWIAEVAGEDPAAWPMSQLPDHVCVYGEMRRMELASWLPDRRYVTYGCVGESASGNSHGLPLGVLELSVPPCLVADSLGYNLPLSGYRTWAPDSSARLHRWRGPLGLLVQEPEAF